MTSVLNNIFEMFWPETNYDDMAPKFHHIVFNAEFKYLHSLLESNGTVQMVTKFGSYSNSRSCV